MKSTLLAVALIAATSAAHAAPEKYSLDPGHSQIVFTYGHLGFSTATGMFSGFEGNITFDGENPANSSVSVSMPVLSMLTGWEARFDHIMADDFFGAKEGDLITFTSTSIDVTGEKTAEITGDLTMNGVSKPVVLDAVMNQMGMHPMAKMEWAGFSATTTVLRSDFGLGAFAPYVSDELDVTISIEAVKDE